MIQNFFPFLLVTLDLGAAIVYMFTEDYRRMIYWIAAAVLTITVTL